jgi:plasmid stabilization system protein ParE
VLTIALTEKADSDLEGIHEHYEAQAGTKAADALIAQVIAALTQLTTVSGMGRPSQGPDVRQLVFSRYPLIALYRIERGRIQVLRVVHQRTERADCW